MNPIVTPMTHADSEAVLRILRDGIATGHSSFDTEAPDWEAWNGSHLEVCRLVARVEGEIAGWAALSPVSSRCVHSGVAEVSVYVGSRFRRIGVGKALMAELIDASEHEGIWTLQGGVFPENTASIALQEAFGFREVGRQERLGKLNGVWRDVVLMERRSRVVGT